MAQISISDLYSSDTQTLLGSIDHEDEDLIKSSVSRALEARGGLNIASIKLCPPILVGIIYNPNLDKTLSK